MNDFTGGPGFLAFVFTFALVIAGVVLFRSLSKHLRKVKGGSSTSSDLRRSRSTATDDADPGEGNAADSGDQPGDGAGDQPAE